MRLAQNLRDENAIIVEDLRDIPCLQESCLCYFQTYDEVWNITMLELPATTEDSKQAYHAMNLENLNCRGWRSWVLDNLILSHTTDHENVSQYYTTKPLARTTTVLCGSSESPCGCTEEVHCLNSQLYNLRQAFEGKTPMFPIITHNLKHHLDNVHLVYA